MLLQKGTEHYRSAEFAYKTYQSIGRPENAHYTRRSPLAQAFRRSSVLVIENNEALQALKQEAAQSAPIIAELPESTVDEYFNKGLRLSIRQAQRSLTATQGERLPTDNRLIGLISIYANNFYDSLVAGIRMGFSPKDALSIAPLVAALYEPTILEEIRSVDSANLSLGDVKSVVRRRGTDPFEEVQRVLANKAARLETQPDLNKVFADLRQRYQSDDYTTRALKVAARRPETAERYLERYQRKLTFLRENMYLQGEDYYPYPAGPFTDATYRLAAVVYKDPAEAIRLVEEWMPRLLHDHKEFLAIPPATLARHILLKHDPGNVADLTDYLEHTKASQKQFSVAIFALLTDNPMQSFSYRDLKTQIFKQFGIESPDEEQRKYFEGALKRAVGVLQDAGLINGPKQSSRRETPYSFNLQRVKDASVKRTLLLSLVAAIENDTEGTFATELPDFVSKINTRLRTIATTYAEKLQTRRAQTNELFRWLRRMQADTYHDHSQDIKRVNEALAKWYLREVIASAENYARAHNIKDAEFGPGDFYRIMQKYSPNSEGSNFKPYYERAIANHFIDYLRRARTHREISMEPELAERIPQPEYDSVVQQQHRKKIFDTLQGILTPEENTVIQLLYVGGFSSRNLLEELKNMYPDSFRSEYSEANLNSFVRRTRVKIAKYARENEEFASLIQELL